MLLSARMPNDPRVALVTIGQTPRVDLVPEMRRWIADTVLLEEFGALDGLERDQVGALAPAAGEQRLVTRLSDGTEAVVGKGSIHHRLQALFDRLVPRNFPCTVLLCTGHFPPFAVRGLFIEAQTVVDLSVAAIAHSAQSIGLMVPLLEQIPEFHFQPATGQVLATSHASPYTPGRLEKAAGELRTADVVVMHCMGYTEAMRCLVASVTGRPVLLARRLVAAAIAQIAEP